jgi:hypothetical protein
VSNISVFDKSCIFANMYGLGTFSETPDRHGTQVHLKRRHCSVLSSGIGPIGDQNDVPYLSTIVFCIFPYIWYTWYCAYPPSSSPFAAAPEATSPNKKLASRYTREPVVESQPDWESAFHGTWWYTILDLQQGPRAMPSQHFIKSTNKNKSL